MLLEPDWKGGEGLEIADGVEDRDTEDTGQEHESGSVVCGEGGGLFVFWFDAGWQVFVAAEVGGQAAEHEDAGDREGDVPAVVLRDQSAEEGAGEGADVDGGAEDGEAFGAEDDVAWRVEGADLSSDVAFEEAGAED